MELGDRRQSKGKHPTRRAAQATDPKSQPRVAMTAPVAAAACCAATATGCQALCLSSR